MGKDNIQLCPNCTEPIPVNDGYVTWCHRCNWNLNPIKPTPPKNVFRKLYFKLSRKYTNALSEQMYETKELKPKVSFSILITYIIAFLVHTVTIALAFVSIMLIIKGWPYFLIVATGIILLITSIYLIPKPLKFNKKNSCKKKFPELFSLINDIAKTLNAPKIDDLVVNNDFNAYYTQYGLIRKRVIGIGLPLFNILSDEEKVAMISHELSHGNNEDIKRTYIVFTAQAALQKWYYFLIPNAIMDTSAGEGMLFMIPFNILMAGLCKVIYGIYYLIETLSWYDSQKAEYLADYNATKACGSDAMISDLNKICFRETLNHTISTHAAKGLTSSLFDELNKNIASVPQREIDRIKLAEIDESSRLDRTHPPLLYRIKFIEKHYIKEKGYVITEEKSLKLNQELKAFIPNLENKIIENYKLRISRKR